MSEWKLATAEQKAWLEAKGDYTCPFAVFLWNAESKGLPPKEHEGWGGFVYGEIRLREGGGFKLYYTITDPELTKAEGFPMGEAVTESPAMRMASDRAEQATMQIKSMYDIQNEQAQAKAQAKARVKSDAEWQKERRSAWVAFASTASVGNRGPLYTAEWADIMLEEFDKRFEEDK